MDAGLRRPIVIGLPCDTHDIDGRPFHVIGDKYVRAVTGACAALPLPIPALADAIDTREILSRVDALLLTGARSNVHPSRYGHPASAAAEPHDVARDRTAFALIEAAFAADLPLLAICRGLQELNVHLGGTLHPRVHELPGRLDHRCPQDPDLDVQYAPRHRVDLVAGGAFATLFDATAIEVNSLHWQAIDTLAPGLVAEGVAEDGTIEAVRVRDRETFALGVQWHPEYKVERDRNSVALFHAFGDAARAHAARASRG